MRLILHIGLPKTGSTALQTALFENRRALSEVGVLYPRLSPYINHNLLSVPFKEKLPRGYAARFGGDRDRAVVSARQAWKDVARQVAASNAHTVVLSGEYFYRLKSNAAFRAQLRQALPNVSEIWVVAYLRRPSAHYLSLLQQLLRASASLPAPRRPRFAGTLRRFKRLGRVMVRESASSELEEGDIVRDFMLHALDLDLELPTSESRQNVSLSSEGMVLMHEFRRKHYPDQDHVFSAHSEAYLAALRRAEATVGPPEKLPHLKRKVARFLDRAHLDDRQLRRQFGFNFAHRQGKIQPKPIRTMEVPREVSDIVRVDPRRLERLRVALDEELKSPLDTFRFRVARWWRWGRTALRR